AVAAVLAIGLAGTLLSLAGRTLVVPDTVVDASRPQENASRPPLSAADEAGSPSPRLAAGREAPAGEVDSEADAVPAQAAPSPATTARAVAPEIVAPPPLDMAELQRTEPRKPLSDLALALPPKPVPPDKWKGTLLHRPVAV